MSLTAAGEVLDALMAGAPASEIEPAFQRLPEADRYAVLCSACQIREEVARNCASIASEIEELLTAHCPYFAEEQRPCDHPLGARLQR